MLRRFQIVEQYCQSGFTEVRVWGKQGVVVWQLNIKNAAGFPRFVCDTGVRVHPEIGNAGYWGTVGDISLGGCYVFTFSPLPVGQVVTLDIKANDKEINVAGKTVSSHPGVGMGVAFNGFTPEDAEERLKGFVQHLASQPKKESMAVFH